MKAALLFNFSVDKNNKQILVERQFRAPRAKVWRCWTEADLLDQWWAPLPYTNHTSSMDFQPGGRWLYSMKGPEGDQHFCRLDYLTVDPEKEYAGLDAFCDEHGTINAGWARMHWTNAFSDATMDSGEAGTLVRIRIRFDQLEDLERVLQMGFAEGFTAGLTQLDSLLAR